MSWLCILIGALIVGTLAGPWTLMHSFALAFDVFCQCLFWNDALGVTISSRAGLAARRGIKWPATVVNTVMLSDTHCEDAIQGDIGRAKASLAVLEHC
jgi:hypothetical protein